MPATCDECGSTNVHEERVDGCRQYWCDNCGYTEMMT